MRFPFSRRHILGYGAPGTLAALVTASTRSDAVPGIATQPGPNSRSIVDFGAVPGARNDNSIFIQRALDAARSAGGGDIFVPPGVFNLERPLSLPSGVTLCGAGPASILHLVDNRRSGAIRATGSHSARLSDIVVRDLTIAGEARYGRDGRPSVINGPGLLFEHADGCDVVGVRVTGFSDGGIHFLNGSRNCVMQCQVEQVAQGISFTASDIDVDDNVAVGNRIRQIGQYNGLHLEGGFGGGRARGEVRHTTLSANVIADCREAGINIELAPYTSCIGNSVHRAGLGRTAIAMGIKVYGGFRSSICGNTIVDCGGTGIIIGANSSECSVVGNITAGNTDALLLTDSATQVSNDVAIGLNVFVDGDVRTEGNVSIRNRVAGLDLGNHTYPDPHVLDWYEEGRFQPTMTGATVTEASGLFTRIGNVVHVALHLLGSGSLDGGRLMVDGLPYPAAIDAPLAVELRERTNGPGLPGKATARAVASSRRALVAVDGLGTAMATWQLSIGGQYLTTE